MAFTKAPEYNTHQTVRLTPKMTLDVATPNEYSAAYPDLAITNAYLIKEGQDYVIYNAPPYETSFFETTVTPGSGVYSLYVPNPDNTSVWFVKDQNFYSVLPSGTSVTTLASGVFSADNIFFKKGFTKYVVGSTVYHVAVDSGSSADAYIVYFNGSGGHSTTTTLTGLKLSPDIVFLDGYLFVCATDTNNSGPGRIYNSTLGSPTTWNTSTDFIDAEIEGDYLRGLAKHHNHLVAFGRTTIEFFYNSGNEVGSPLQRQANYAKNVGLIGNHVTIGDIIYFIGVEGGKIGFYKIEKFNISKISFPLLDRYLNKTPFNFVTVNSVAFDISPFVLEHDTGIVFPFVTGFHTTLIYLPTYETFSSFDYLYGQGLAGRCQSVPVGTGNAFITANYDVGNLKITSVIRTDDISILSYPGAYIYFQNEGYNNDIQKHIKWVDVNGLFRADDAFLSVYLSGIKGKEIYGASITNFTPHKTPDTLPNDAPLRWRNLGRSRYHTFKVEILGNGQFRLDNLEIAYNLGTH